jgi:hypothetical protein
MSRAGTLVPLSRGIYIALHTIEMLLTTVSQTQEGTRALRSPITTTMLPAIRVSRVTSSLQAQAIELLLNGFA